MNPWGGRDKPGSSRVEEWVQRDHTLKKRCFARRDPVWVDDETCSGKLVHRGFGTWRNLSELARCRWSRHSMFRQWADPPLACASSAPSLTLGRWLLSCAARQISGRNECAQLSRWLDGKGYGATKRLPVAAQYVAHMFAWCQWCWYTRERFERKHAGVWNARTGFGVRPSNHQLLPIWSLRIGRFAKIDRAVHFQLSWSKQTTRLFDCSFAQKPSVKNYLYVSIATSLTNAKTTHEHEHCTHNTHERHNKHTHTTADHNKTHTHQSTTTHTTSHGHRETEKEGRERERREDEREKTREDKRETYSNTLTNAFPSIGTYSHTNLHIHIYTYTFTVIMFGCMSTGVCFNFHHFDIQSTARKSLCVDTFWDHREKNTETKETRRPHAHPLPDLPWKLLPYSASSLSSLPLRLSSLSPTPLPPGTCGPIV